MERKQQNNRIVLICPYSQFQEYLKSEISRQIPNSQIDLIEHADSMFMDSLAHINIEKHEKGKEKPYFILDFEMVLCPYSEMAIDAGDDFCNSIGRYTSNPNQKNLGSVVKSSPWFVESTPDCVEIYSGLKPTSTRWPDEHLDVSWCTDYRNWANGCNNDSNHFFHTPNDELLLHFHAKLDFTNELRLKRIYDIHTRNLLPNAMKVRPYIPLLKKDIKAIIEERYGDLILFEKSEPIN